jgi:hypothetical protein
MSSPEKLLHKRSRMAHEHLAAAQAAQAAVQEQIAAHLHGSQPAAVEPPAETEPPAEP